MKKIIIMKNSTLKDALYALNDSGEKCLIVSNNFNKLLGTLSDGDLRKSLLLGVNLNEKKYKIYNKKPTFLYENKIRVGEVCDKAQSRGLTPVLFQIHASIGSGSRDCGFEVGDGKLFWDQHNQWGNPRECRATLG